MLSRAVARPLVLVESTSMELHRTDLCMWGDKYVGKLHISFEEFSEFVNSCYQRWPSVDLG